MVAAFFSSNGFRTLNACAVSAQFYFFSNLKSESKVWRKSLQFIEKQSV